MSLKIVKPSDPINVTINDEGQVEELGLTKREHFAGLAMQALIGKHQSVNQTTALAVEYADALILALNTIESAEVEEEMFQEDVQ